MIRIADLVARVERVKLDPQSPMREAALAKLEFEIDILRYDRESRIARLALFLFEAHEKNGSMSVMILGKGQLTEQAEFGESPLDYVWNVKEKAKQLARLATP